MVGSVDYSYRDSPAYNASPSCKAVAKRLASSLRLTVKVCSDGGYFRFGYVCPETYPVIDESRFSERQTSGIPIEPAFHHPEREKDPSEEGFQAQSD